MPLAVRPAVAADVPALARIYGHAVRTGVATFDVQDPPPQYWADKIADTAPGRHVLVAERSGDVVGFAYASSFRPRPAYGRTVETSVYLAPDAVGAGIGSTLYRDLLERLTGDGMHAAIAVIARPNPASDALHARFGFRPAGVLREVGRKFDHWVDIGLHQRTLAWTGPIGTIRTARLALTPLTVGDAPEMRDVLADPRLYDFVGGEPPSVGQLRERFARQERGRSPDGAQDWLNWIVRTADGVAVGMVQATVTGVGASAELAWIIGTPWWGRGFAREAATAGADWLRGQGVGRLLAHVHPDHGASAAVARAVGLAPTAHIHDGERRWEWRAASG